MGWKTMLGGVATALVLLLPVRASAGTIDWPRVSDEALQRLQAYVRVDTTNPPGHETPAAELLRGWLAAEGIETQSVRSARRPTAAGAGRRACRAPPAAARSC